MKGRLKTFDLVALENRYRDGHGVVSHAEVSTTPAKVWPKWLRKDLTAQELGRMLGVNK